MAATTTKAVSYLRVSGRGQVEGDGFPRQRDAVTRWSKANGVELVGEYRDEGVSGTAELADREGLAELLDRIESNGVRLVLVERADRLARDLIVGELILDRFRELGVRVVAADGGHELTCGDDDPTRLLIRQVLGAVAQFDKTSTVLKLRAARQRIRRTTGRCEGRKPFGERAGEGDTIERIRQLRRKPRGGERLSWGEVADTLNRENRTTRTGKPWNRATVFRIGQRVGLN